MPLMRIRRPGWAWDPWDETEVERRGPRRSGPGEREATPPVDLYDTGATLIAKVDLPGVKPEDVEVTVGDGRVLAVRATRPAEAVEEERYLCCERPAGRFARNVELPVEVDAEAVRATLHLGVLEVVLPKSKSAVPRKVTVSVQ